MFRWDGDNLAQPLTEWADGNTKMVFTYRPGRDPYVVSWQQGGWIPINLLVWVDGPENARAVFADYLVFKRAVAEAYLAHNKKREAEYGRDCNTDGHIFEALRILKALDATDYAKEAIVKPLKPGWVYKMDWCDQALSV